MASKGRGSRSRRGNAAQLKTYWSTGAGSTKIRWNTRGDHTRCSRQLAKYLGPRGRPTVHGSTSSARESGQEIVATWVDVAVELPDCQRQMGP